jgi:Uma2 family endonuclease
MHDPIDMTTRTRASISDFYSIPSSVKAELVRGEIVIMSSTGAKPGNAAGIIDASLLNHAMDTGVGWAFPDNVGFLVNLPHRESFSPDAAYFLGSRDTMKFLEGAPIFAVEVRSERDYGPSAERAMAQKWADYFACGTLVVWDADLLSDEVVRSYRADQPYTPTVFCRGEIANAVPALEAWALEVNRLFL